MKIVKISSSEEWCNTYFIGEEGKPCLIVDPGDNSNNRLDNYLSKHHGVCVGILITHGHSDHIAGLATLKIGAPVFMMEEDERCLYDGKYSLDKSLDLGNIRPYLLSDEDEIKLGDYLVTVIATPFHTEGSCCFYFKQDNVLFSGDTLFHLAIGRTDFPGGDEDSVEPSLAKLAKLPAITKVYPGHYGETTIGNEIKYNPAFCFLAHR